MEIAPDPLPRDARALLDAARRLAASAHAEQALGHLLAEATRLLGSEDGVVRRWDPSLGLVPVAGTLPDLPLYPALAARQSLSARALDAGRSVVVNDYPGEVGDASPAVTAAGVRSGVAAPLRLAGRPLGTVSVLSREPGRRFDQRDADLLELLAGVAAAALVSIEAARLEALLLAARTAEEDLVNPLTLAVGYTDLMLADPDLPPHLRAAAAEARHGAAVAAEWVHRLRRLTRAAETTLGGADGPRLAPSPPPP